MRVFTFEPDWSQDFKLSYRWQTLVQESLSTREVRRSMQPAGLRTQVGLFVMFDPDASAAIRLFFTSGAEEPAKFPFYLHQRWITGFAGRTTVTVSDTRHFFVGGQALFIRAWNDWELRTILSIISVDPDTFSGTLTLDSAVSDSWAENDPVYPVLNGFVTTDSGKMDTDDMFDGNVTLSEENL